jgi:carboxypeptidase Taq
MTSYQNLEARFKQIAALEDLRSIAGWDEAVVMPVGGSESRGRSLAALGEIIQNLSTAPEIGRWLDGCENEKLAQGPWQAANVREMRRTYLEQTAIPKELNQKLIIAKMTCEQKWRVMREQNNWQGFLPVLSELLDLTREMLGGLGKIFSTEKYDTGLNQFSRGLNSQIVEKLFGEIRHELPGYVTHALERQEKEKLIFPEGSFPMAAQKALGLELMKAIGFSFENGRLDESHHPFCGGTARDVRITTRYDETDFVSSLMGVLHETGHALYEQNLPEEWLGQPVGLACGMSIHESQSLFMEMQVCRSREFLEFAQPFIERHMGQHVKNPDSLKPDNLHKLMTRVERGLIRVDADELTYPAHIILRFEIERDLIEGRLQIKELPRAWNEKMQSLLGLSTLGNDKNGCMQDVHWPSGSFGYFPAYTFGAVIAAQLMNTVQKSIPGVSMQIAKGQFGPVQAWLRENIWSQGSRLQTLELVEQATQAPLSSEYFLKHLRLRYLN